MNLLFVSTTFGVTDQIVLAFLLEEHLIAGGAFFVSRHIPRGEGAIGISAAAVEDRLISAAFDHKRLLALGTFHTQILQNLLGKVALGVIAAGIEASESSLTSHHLCAALGAEFAV